MPNYEPFRTDVFRELVGNITGRTTPCRHCGVKPANGHTLGQLSACDWAKKSPAEKAKILAAKAAKEVAA